MRRWFNISISLAKPGEIFVKRPTRLAVLRLSCRAMAGGGAVIPRVRERQNTLGLVEQPVFFRSTIQETSCGTLISDVIPPAQTASW